MSQHPGRRERAGQRQPYGQTGSGGRSPDFSSYDFGRPTHAIQPGRIEQHDAGAARHDARRKGPRHMFERPRLDTGAGPIVDGFANETAEHRHGQAEPALADRNVQAGENPASRRDCALAPAHVALPSKTNETPRALRATGTSARTNPTVSCVSSTCASRNQVGIGNA